MLRAVSFGVPSSRSAGQKPTMGGVALLWLRFLVAGRTPVTYDRVLRSFGAGFALLLGITAWIAVSHPDPVLSEDYYRQGLDINKTMRQEEDRSLMPAQQARNHAATPVDAPVRRAP